MALIKDINQLKPLIDTGKALQKMNVITPVAGAVSNDDSWDRIERIITGIDHLLDTALKVKQDSQPQAGRTRQVLTDTSNAAGQNAVNAKQAENAEKKDGELMKIGKQMIEFLTQHVNTCVKENPNMTLAECVDKMPINVTQLAVLLQLASKMKGG